MEVKKVNKTKETKQNKKASKKPVKKQSNAKKPGKSREAIRQEEKIKKLLTIKELLDKTGKEMFDKMINSKSEAYTPLDRHLIHLEISMIEVLSSIIWTRACFEKVRTRSHSGELVNTDNTNLLRFIFGAADALERKSQCSCNGKCKCKK